MKNIDIHEFHLWAALIDTQLTKWRMDNLRFEVLMGVIGSLVGAKKGVSIERMMEETRILTDPDYFQSPEEMAAQLNGIK